jgi:hypothetical protein
MKQITSAYATTDIDGSRVRALTEQFTYWFVEYVRWNAYASPISMARMILDVFPQRVWTDEEKNQLIDLGHACYNQLRYFEQDGQHAKVQASMAVLDFLALVNSDWVQEA